MEELKFSILACVYGNFLQFKNFLSTAILQHHPSYEIIVVDNAHPNNDICDVCSVCIDYDVGVPIR